jgi:hypothetical protein
MFQHCDELEALRSCSNMAQHSHNKIFSSHGHLESAINIFHPLEAILQPKFFEIFFIDTLKINCRMKKMRCLFINNPYNLLLMLLSF